MLEVTTVQNGSHYSPLPTKLLPKPASQYCSMHFNNITIGWCQVRLGIMTSYVHMVVQRNSLLLTKGVPIGDWRHKWRQINNMTSNYIKKTNTNKVPYSTGKWICETTFVCLPANGCKMLCPRRELLLCYRMRKNLINLILFSSLSADRSKASSKTIPPHSAIQSLLFQMTVSSPVLKVIQ